MKTILFLAAIGSGMLSNALAESARHIDVCMGTGTNLLPFWQAKKISATMLSTAGVDVTWHWIGRQCPAAAIKINVREGTDRRGRTYSLAQTWPYQGTRIDLFYSRICAVAGPQRSAILLAHVITHEIGHILQGVSRHSASGVMKAHFDEQDIQQMMRQPLTFTQIDIDLIQDGFDSGTRSKHAT